MSLATATEYALMLAADPQPPAEEVRAGPRAGAGRGSSARADRERGDGGPGQAQPTGARTGHADRAGSHWRADRGPAVYHRAHGQLAPGPSPGQDRLPPPRRPHPTSTQRRPGL